MNFLVLYDTEDPLGGEILAYLKENGPDNMQYIDLNQENLKACTGCFNCWLRTPGLCHLKDNAVAIQKDEIRCDRVLFLGPITWGGFSPVLKTLQDRSIGFALPFFKTYKGETHHPNRYNHHPKPYFAGYSLDLLQDEIDVFRRLGENISDNLYKKDVHTIILQGKDDRKQLDCFWEGEDV